MLLQLRACKSAVSGIINIDHHEISLFNIYITNPRREGHQTAFWFRQEPENDVALFSPLQIPFPRPVMQEWPPRPVSFSRRLKTIQRVTLHTYHQTSIRFSAKRTVQGLICIQIAGEAACLVCTHHIPMMLMNTCGIIVTFLSFSQQVTKELIWMEMVLLIITAWVLRKKGRAKMTLPFCFVPFYVNTNHQAATE